MAHIASARALTTLRPSSKERPPPKTSAEYSPSEKPAREVVPPRPLWKVFSALWRLAG